MKKLIVCCFLLIFISCVNSAQNTPYQKIIQNDIFNNMKKIYRVDGNEILQVLGTGIVSKNELDFVLFVYNKKTEKTCHIAGKAIKKEGDMEFDEDEFGNSIPVNEYIYNNNCWIAIRISQDEKTASTTAAECKSVDEEKLLPFSSIGLMKKQN